MRWGFLRIATGLLAGALLFPAQAEAVKVRRGDGSESHRSVTVSAAAIEHVEVKDIPSRNASAPDTHTQTANTEMPQLPPAQGRLEALIEHILKQESGMEESSVADMSTSTEEQLQREQIEEIMKSVAGVQETRSPFRTVPVPVAKRLL